MKYPGYDSYTILLSEGDWFPFRIHNLVHLQDDAWYYILEDVNGLKHFMPAEFYEFYNMKPGDEIICKIDKINCTGRIFLEPKHPIYIEGEKYSFDILFMPGQNNKNMILVKDYFGNGIEVPGWGIEKIATINNNKVNCIVKSIRKGKPILEIFNYYS